MDMFRSSGAHAPQAFVLVGQQSQEFGVVAGHTLPDF
jgi:hypothetical protein